MSCTLPHPGWEEEEEEVWEGVCQLEGVGVVVVEVDGLVVDEAEEEEEEEEEEVLPSTRDHPHLPCPPCSYPQVWRCHQVWHPPQVWRCPQVWHPPQV